MHRGRLSLVLAEVPCISGQKRPQAHRLRYLYQHAGYVIVLRGGADEGVEIAYHTAEEFIRE